MRDLKVKVFGRKPQTK